MAKMTAAQKEVLRLNEWKYSNGGWYSCRVCRHPIPTWEYAWFSPGMAAYHPGCVLEAKQVQRLLNKAINA